MLAARIARPLALALAVGTLGTIAALATPLARAQERPEPTSALEHRYLDDIADRPYFQYARIDVRARGHSLTLVGRVETQLHRALAELLARNLPGVGAVESELEVDPTLPRWRPGPAEQLRTAARNVLRRLREDAQLGQYSTLHAVADDGRILLRGVVAREGERQLAQVLAQFIAGSFPVANEIRVDRAASRTAPGPAPDAETDAIERELASVLEGDALLHDGCAFEVTVRGRRVVLGGRVPDQVHHDYAIELLRLHIDQLAHEAPVVARALGPFERKLAGLVDDSVVDDTAEVPEPRADPRTVISDVIVGSGP